MATKSILNNNIVLKEHDKIVRFANVLEGSVTRKEKKVCFSRPVSNMSRDTIKKLFGDKR
ncbi:MAG: hypothetical protein HGA27_00440 [Peptococcaceae bacterium]|nr:hypothetical protein [Peptococcaceae bacterium]